MSWQGRLDLKPSPVYAGTSTNTSLAPAPRGWAWCLCFGAFKYQIPPDGTPGVPLLRGKNRVVMYIQTFLALFTIPEHSSSVWKFRLH